MSRRCELPVFSFGCEVPEPDLDGLAEWVSGSYGKEGDIVSYMLDRSGFFQAGISDPCAGGLFYTERVLSCITGLSGTEVTGEPSIDPEMLRMDGRMVRSSGRYVRMAIPAPSVLGLTDSYFEDDDEFTEEMARLCKGMIRVHRDSGVSGHVLIADLPGETEMDILASGKVRFFVPDPGEEALEVVMDHQRDIAVPASKLSLFLEMMDNYKIRSVSVVDAGEKDLLVALEHFDPGEVSVGGYCTEGCKDYWLDLKERAILVI